MRLLEVCVENKYVDVAVVIMKCLGAKGMTIA